MSNGELNIDPMVLVFPLELRKKIPSVLTLTNSSNEKVAFKIKTTAPRRYCVKPNQGIVLPDGSVEISIVMQALESWPEDPVCRDKFLVQSCPTDFTDADEFPTDMFSDEKDHRKVKLKVVHNRGRQPASVPEDEAGEAHDRVANGRPNVGGSEATEIFREPVTQQADLERLRADYDNEIAAHNLTKSLLAQEKRTHETAQTQSLPTRSQTSLILVLLVALFAFFAGRFSN